MSNFKDYYSLRFYEQDYLNEDTDMTYIEHCCDLYGCEWLYGHWHKDGIILDDKIEEYYNVCFFVGWNHSIEFEIDDNVSEHEIDKIFNEIANGLKDIIFPLWLDEESNEDYMYKKVLSYVKKNKNRWNNLGFHIAEYSL